MWLHVVEDAIVDGITFFGDNIWVCLLLAPCFGLLMSFTPCCLGHVAMAVRCVQGDTKKTRLTNSLYFVLGGAVVFVAVGLFVWAIGAAMSDSEWLFHTILGSILVAVVFWALFFDKKHKRHSHNALVSTQTSVLIGSLDKDIAVLESDEVDCECHVHAHNHSAVPTSKTRLMAHGFAGAVFAFPCSIPVLLGFLSIAQSVENGWLGITMIGLYIVGHNVLPVVAGVSSKKLFNVHGKGAKVMGLLKIAVLLLMLFYAGLMIFSGLYEKFGDHDGHGHDEFVLVLNAMHAKLDVAGRLFLKLCSI